VKGGLLRRWGTVAIDTLSGSVLNVGTPAIVASTSSEGAFIAAVVLLLAYFVWYFDMLRKGTPTRTWTALASCILQNEPDHHTAETVVDSLSPQGGRP